LGFQKSNLQHIQDFKTNMAQKIHFITYGDGRAEYFEGANRLASQAEATGWFHTVTVWSSLLLKSLEPEWFDIHKAQFKEGSRGHGYWIWKAKIIETMLKGIPEDDILVYLDAGCEINSLGQARFHNYLDIVNRFGFMFFYLNGSDYQICQWTKASLLKKFELYDAPQEIMSLPQMESGVLFFKNTKATRSFVNEWAKLSVEDDYSLINDVKTEDDELPTFVENRHDQAILSLLFLKHEYGVAIKNENFYLLEWDKFSHPEIMPIAALRNLTTDSLIEKMKLVPHQANTRYLWIRNHKPIYLDMSDCDMKNKMISRMVREELTNCPIDLNDFIVSEISIELISRKLKEIEYDLILHRIKLLRNLFSNRDLKIKTLNKTILAKEKIIYEQGQSLQERLTSLLEKQSCIDGQVIILDQRLNVINQNAKDFIDLRGKIAHLENKIQLSGLTLIDRVLHQLRTFKSVRKAKLLNDSKDLKNTTKRLIHAFLHELRVIKHASKYVPNHLNAHLISMKEAYKHWARGVAGLELGHLKTHKPRKVKIPAFYKFTKKIINPPRISIITPSYQQGDFIERTIKSVLSQDYPNLEYIIQDGGSKDNTLNIIKKYEKKLTSFESKKDKGQSNAINDGFSKSTGEIMSWLNSDDVLLPGALNYVADFFQNNPNVDVIYGNRVIINEDDLQIGRWIMPDHEDEILSWADYIPQETLFWRRNIWERSGSTVNESFHFAMDWDLILRFRQLDAKIVRLPRLIGGFRVHDNQKTKTNIKITGTNEMNILRERELGFIPDDVEIHKHLKKYIANHQYENFKWKIRELFLP
jgi:glycosyltransferase involved in cell wall biosynthesis